MAREKVQRHYAEVARMVNEAEIEPKTVYTRDVLLEKAQRKERMDHFQRIADKDIDSKTGSVIIVAWK